MGGEAAHAPPMRACHMGGSCPPPLDDPLTPVPLRPATRWNKKRGRFEAFGAMRSAVVAINSGARAHEVLDCSDYGGWVGG